MRSKIPKIFSIQKSQNSSHRKNSYINKSSSCYDERPVRKTYGSVFKIDRYKEHRKRPCIRPSLSSKIQQRICNDYPNPVQFKITKVGKRPDPP
mmetsp:Transcript_16626/g.14524  ORF Transcript_16626/g.14524 Transcript_16626/m.14524 type:complete len:94 (+) Transcript_16626:402-683(+)